jgi:hypothetical protein
MNQRLVCFTLILLLLGSNTYADKLTLKLNKVSLELDKVEIFAANCATDAKTDKEIHPNCIIANGMLQQANDKLDRIAAQNGENVSEVIANIKRLRAKISRVNEHLTEAKIATGDYQWSNSYIPGMK